MEVKDRRKSKLTLSALTFVREKRREEMQQPTLPLRAFYCFAVKSPSVLTVSDASADGSPSARCP